MSRLHRQKLRQIRSARALGAEEATEAPPAPIVKPTRAKATKRKAVQKASR